MSSRLIDNSGPDARQGDHWLSCWCSPATSFHARLTALNQLAGRRMKSAEAAQAWLHLMEAAAVRQLLSPPQTELLTRQFLMLAPDHAQSELLFSALVNRPEPAPAPPHGLVFMITSCARYIDAARRQFDALTRRDMAALIVIGEPALAVPEFEADRSLVRLPVEDTYEALTSKVLEGLTFLRRRYGGSTSIAKIDDDTQLLPAFNGQVLAGMARSHHYVGNAWRASDRCFHLGKTAHPIPIYARRSPALFAGGPMYLLGPRAVEHLVREWVFYPGEFEGLLYEDRAIGEGLRRAGIEPHQQSFAGMGIAPKIDDRFASAA